MNPEMLRRMRWAGTCIALVGVTIVFAVFTLLRSFPDLVGLLTLAGAASPFLVVGGILWLVAWILQGKFEG